MALRQQNDVSMCADSSPCMPLAKRALDMVNSMGFTSEQIIYKHAEFWKLFNTMIKEQEPARRFAMMCTKAESMLLVEYVNRELARE